MKFLSNDQVFHLDRKYQVKIVLVILAIVIVIMVKPIKPSFHVLEDKMLSK